MYVRACVYKKIVVSLHAFYGVKKWMKLFDMKEW